MSKDRRENPNDTRSTREQLAEPVGKKPSSKFVPEHMVAYWKRLLDERVRTYVVVAGAALLVLFLAQITGGSLLAGLIPLMCGVLAMALGWYAMPFVCIFAVAWFQVLPFGVPTGIQSNINPATTHFRITDLMLVSSMLVYLIAQFRVYSLAWRALPDERPLVFIPKSEPIEKRDPALIEESEIPRCFMAVAGIVVLGQALWLLLSETLLDFNRFPAIRMREDTKDIKLPVGESPSVIFTPEWSRFILFVLTSGAIIFLMRLCLWYWRLRTLTQEEARLILVDTGWSEMRREAARQETWRISGILKATPAMPKMKPIPRPQRTEPRKPWFFAALGRGCFLVLIAGIVAVILVVVGVYLMDLRQRR